MEIKAKKKSKKNTQNIIKAALIPKSCIIAIFAIFHWIKKYQRKIFSTYEKAIEIDCPFRIDYQAYNYNQLQYLNTN